MLTLLGIMAGVFYSGAPYVIHKPHVRGPLSYTRLFGLATHWPRYPASAARLFEWLSTPPAVVLLFGPVPASALYGVNLTTAHFGWEPYILAKLLFSS